MTDRVTIRVADPDDAIALERLAALDSKRLPPGRLLVAEVDGELWAAVSLGGAAPVADVADPFRPSGELVLLLHERARQLERAARPRRRGAVRALMARGRGAADDGLGELA
ncbi:MAG: hypothetical protein QOH72_4253 [Solirubrobacteraceae bacterium]|jgi:hypothetical protein|nr:hypothetical protein [Solirubrobacteraceae bacterium]